MCDDELVEADPARLPFGDDRPAVERDPLGQRARMADALAVERNAFVEAAELHRMAQGRRCARSRGRRPPRSAARSRRGSRAKGEGRRSSVRRAIASMSLGRRHSAGQALGGGHGRGTRGGRYRQQPCPPRRRPLEERPSSELRSGGRVVEGARLESEYTAKPYRGFESLPLRQLHSRQALDWSTVSQHARITAAILP